MKIAVMILHGAGTPTQSFAEKMIEKISVRFEEKMNGLKSEEALVFVPVFWSTVFETEEKNLWERLQSNADLDYLKLRQFTVEFLADAIAYQPTTHKNSNYDKVHAILARGLAELEKQAGSYAPLCVISHSLGSVIASNFFYDLQEKQENIGGLTWGAMNSSPIGRGETLALFYTLGSPIALWSLRFRGYGIPVHIPSKLISNYFSQVSGEWLNFYDKDDILAYPLKSINENYHMTVSEDIQVNAGGVLSGWNPLSHTHYESDDKVIKKIVEGLVQTWKEMNNKK